MWLWLPEPNFQKSTQVKRIDTLNGNSHNTSFNITQFAQGKSSVFFELTAPDRCDDHVFDSHTINFDFG